MKWIRNNMIHLNRYSPQRLQLRLINNDIRKNFKWTDISIIKNGGRAFEADTCIISPQKSILFPRVKCTTLDGVQRTFPDDIKSKIKFISFSFKQYGFALVKSWNDPFIENISKINSSPLISVAEICFVEYSFLSMAKSAFISGLKPQFPDNRHQSVGLAFGGVKELSSHLGVPNVFTGYVYLLDNKNRVRWKGCGKAKPGETDMVFQFAQKLANES